ncbi:MAG TPA: hypothetical protein VFJ76_07965 [Solirubrobacterales bacterium]|nr:hypothetical protein [Solirubrobacterales bacterium]
MGEAVARFRAWTEDPVSWFWNGLSAFVLLGMAVKAAMGEPFAPFPEAACLFFAAMKIITLTRLARSSKERGE